MNPEAVDENGVEDGLLQEPLPEPIVKMAVAPNGRFLACFSRDGWLAVMSSNFATKVCVFVCAGGVRHSTEAVRYFSSAPPRTNNQFSPCGQVGYY